MKEAVLSVNNASLESSGSYAIYPNPTKGLLYFNGKNSFQKQIDVYDVSGNTVYQNNTASNKFDISNLSTGLYLIKVKSGEGEVFHRIFKN
ncbi:T9SS type A sorting domain-containing protein [Aquimarina agarivorans]|uniref:T9SS type A sorting domain-containing protein n=1 Tax=Aquimarina agarivorans TaxID=980584 RepID=UPI000248EB07|nr:T9SS type A sorting domain-containing protein [Aquimarina agarivorans]